MAQQFRIGWAILQREFEDAERNIELLEANWGESPDARVVAAQGRANLAATPLPPLPW